MASHSRSATQKSVSKGERLELRVTGEQKRLIERAAELRGSTMTDLIVATVLNTAREAIREHDILVLNDEASRAFASALLKAPTPNARAKAAWRRYRKNVTRR